MYGPEEHYNYHHNEYYYHYYYHPHYHNVKLCSPAMLRHSHCWVRANYDSGDLGDIQLHSNGKDIV